jgi:hypothetical protein
MPVKLKEAKASNDDSESKVHLEFHVTSGCVHNLKLHQDKMGRWWPELKISLDQCHDMDVNQIIIAVVERLEEVQKIMLSDEFESLQSITKMVSNQRDK